jgi:hypothetical protein
MVFQVKLGYLCSIYNILCFFSWGGGGGGKVMQNVERGRKVLRFGDLGYIIMGVTES